MDAGAAGITAGRFVMAIAIGRGIRYFGEGLLAVWYGEAALRFLDEGGFDLEEAAAVGVGYYDALVRQSIAPPESPDEVAELVRLLGEGVGADSIVAYAVELGPKNAMEALRQGIPLELARVLFAPQDEEEAADD